MHTQQDTIQPKTITRTWFKNFHNGDEEVWISLRVIQIMFVSEIEKKLAHRRR